MNTYIRYFISPGWGKALVSVDAAGAAAGQVRIDVLAPTERSIAFWFPLENLRLAGIDADGWADAAARIAIAQAIRYRAGKGERGLFNTTHALACALAPWAGELACVPYGDVAERVAPSAPRTDATGGSSRR